MRTQYDVKLEPKGNVLKYTPCAGIILGSDVHGATSRDIANLPLAARFFQSLAIGQFVSAADKQRTVSGQPISLAGHVSRKMTRSEGNIIHYTLCVK